MTVYIFAGPTLTSQEVLEVLDATVLPPVSQGDVYRATLNHPDALGIIDGRFRDVPAVWHKEILWALHQGIPVFGSASTGALRAAELAAYGMQGVGTIFAAYSDGTLEDDDEVAVATAGPEANFVATSAAMVNVRATLQAAQLAGVVSRSTHDELIAAAKGTFFPDRTYPLLLKQGREAGVPEEEMAALERWLPQNRVDKKRADALEMLACMKEYLDRGPERHPASFHFEHTRFFEEVRRNAGELVSDTPMRTTSTTGRITLDDVLDELRLDRDLYTDVSDRATLRCLAVREARNRETPLDTFDLESAAIAFRRTRGLLRARDVELWLSANHLRPNQFFTLLKHEFVVRRMKRLLGGELQVYLRDQLRIEGLYATLAARAEAKRRALDAAGRHSVASAIEDPDEEKLLRWYFVDRSGGTIPSDPETYARGAGFADYLVFLRALKREFRYSRLDPTRNGAWVGAEPTEEGTVAPRAT
jgi:hypothetical protein